MHIKTKERTKKASERERERKTKQKDQILTPELSSTLVTSSKQKIPMKS